MKNEPVVNTPELEQNPKIALEKYLEVPVDASPLSIVDNYPGDDYELDPNNSTIMDAYLVASDESGPMNLLLELLNPTSDWRINQSQRNQILRDLDSQVTSVFPIVDSDQRLLPIGKNIRSVVEAFDRMNKRGSLSVGGLPGVNVNVNDGNIEIMHHSIEFTKFIRALMEIDCKMLSREFNSYINDPEKVQKYQQGQRQHQEISNYVTMTDSYRMFISSLLHLESRIDQQGIASYQKLLLELITHSYYTFWHSINTAYYATNVIRNLLEVAKRNDKYKISKMSQEEIDEYLRKYYLMVLLHDVGKLRCDKNDVNSKAVDKETILRMQQHVNHFRDVIKEKLGFEPRGVFRSIGEQHHMNNNGSGYQAGEKEHSVSIEAKVLRVLDSFDVVKSAGKGVANGRPYHHSAMRLRELIRDFNGKFLDGTYDPKLFSNFQKMIYELALKTGIIYHSKLEALARKDINTASSN